MENKPKFWDYVRRGYFIVKIWCDRKIKKFHIHSEKMKQKGKEMRERGKAELKEIWRKN